MADRPQIRCAIYTRKSSEEGLEQNFNSLDAQREACSAYIQSQRQEGWRECSTTYDDGGYSGGNLERPGLQQLLLDIKARQIDLIVVYKIDRLTRSLTDFATLVGVFDTHKTSFVSVTQSFNTTTSMGRLTLNVLLSFAQFEREITGERIRDKISASKRKGLWMGGTVPLGYQSVDKQLKVVPHEAAQVRRIFQHYCDVRSVAKLQALLHQSKEISKVRSTPSGKRSGGLLFSRGALYLILKNRVYRGEIPHLKTFYPGQHAAIIESKLWEQVQIVLQANRDARHLGQRMCQPSLLTGLLVDESGRSLSPSHTRKGDRRYRYYIARGAAQSANLKASRICVPAHDLERVVLSQLVTWMRSPDWDQQLLGSQDRPHYEGASLIAAAQGLCHELPAMPLGAQRDWLTRIIQRIEVGRQAILIKIDQGQLQQSLLDGSARDPQQIIKPDGTNAALLTQTVPARLQRCGGEMRIIDPSAPGPHSVLPHHVTLLHAIARARTWLKRMESGAVSSMAALARAEGLADRYVTRLLRCAFLAPDIIDALFTGKAPPELTLACVLKGIPTDWADQRRRFGVASSKCNTSVASSLETNISGT